MRIVLLSPLVLLLVMPAAAQQLPQKGTVSSPWTWDENQRIEARLAAANASRQAAGRLASSSQAAEFTIDGTTHPELFLPHELMRRVLRGVSSDPLFRAGFRTQLSEAIRHAGFDEADFWSVLDRIGAHHAQLSRRSADLRSALDRSNPTERRLLEPRADAASAEVCSARVEALQDARAAFGRERFDRFLYEGVAPTFSLTLARDDDDAHLRFLERGCR